VRIIGTRFNSDVTFSPTDYPKIVLWNPAPNLDVTGACFRHGESIVLSECYTEVKDEWCYESYRLVVGHDAIISENESCSLPAAVVEHSTESLSSDTSGSCRNALDWTDK